MFRMKHNKPIFHYLTLLLVIMFVYAGCSSFSQKKENTASQPTAEQAEEATAPSGTCAWAGKA